MPSQSGNSFELDESQENHVSDPAHASVIRQRRQRLQAWLLQIDGLPEVPEKDAFHEMVCYGQQLQRELTDLSARLKRYANRTTLRRPFNTFLLAPPGSGKSSLVRSVSQSLGIQQASQLIEINFSNLLSAEQAIPIFERLRLLRDNRLLPIVLFDEIDIPQWSVYQFMLMPMWEGACIVRGIPVEFGKSIFFFAGSTQPHRNRAKYVVYGSAADWVSTSRQDLDQWLEDNKKKAPDFFSRIDFRLHMPPAHCHFQQEWDAVEGPYWQDVETVMITQRMIQKYFPKTSSLDARVLLYLAGALLSSRRELDRLLFFSTMEESGTDFLWEHLPTEVLAGGRWYDHVQTLPPHRITLSSAPSK